MDKRRPAVREEEQEPLGQRLTPVPPALFESAHQPMWRPDHLPKRPVWATVSAAVPLRRRNFPSVSTEEWSDWRWQLSHRITRAEELKRFLVLSADELSALSLAGGRLPVAITPYYLTLPSSLKRNWRHPTTSSARWGDFDHSSASTSPRDTWARAERPMSRRFSKCCTCRTRAARC